MQTHIFWCCLQWCISNKNIYPFHVHASIGRCNERTKKSNEKMYSEAGCRLVVTWHPQPFIFCISGAPTYPLFDNRLKVYKIQVNHKGKNYLQVSIWSMMMRFDKCESFNKIILQYNTHSSQMISICPSLENVFEDNTCDRSHSRSRYT